MISKAKFNFTKAIKNNDPISRISLRSPHSSLVMKRRSNTFSTCLRLPPKNELMRIDEAAGKMIIMIILQDTIWFHSLDVSRILVDTRAEKFNFGIFRSQESSLRERLLCLTPSMACVSTTVLLLLHTYYVFMCVICILEEKNVGISLSHILIRMYLFFLPFSNYCCYFSSTLSFWLDGDE